MRYEYECVNCGTKNKPHDFEADMPLEFRHNMPKCPKCKKKTGVRKVIRTAFPTSHSWRP